MDDDGVSLLKHIPIKVRVEVSGDKMTIDLSDVSPQVAGFYNSGITAGRSAAEVVFKCVTAPLLLPINDGSFRPLKIILPPGRVVSAVKPAPVRVWMTVPMTVCDTIFRALAPACPERTICAPWGLHGGKDALANRISIERKDGTVEKFPTGKIKPTEIDAGDSFLIETAGGGGFWNSLERDPERVLADVRAGYVSLEAARRDYGVVIQQRGRRFDLDGAATAELRRQMTSSVGDGEYLTKN